MSAREKYMEWELKVMGDERLEVAIIPLHHSNVLFLDLVSKPMSETVFQISLNQYQKQMGMTSSIWKLLIWRKIYFLSMCKWLIKSEVCAEKELHDKNFSADRFGYRSFSSCNNDIKSGSIVFKRLVNNVECI